MDIYIHNTLSGKKELFQPLRSGVVGMYNCGPTVYNFAHIGNLRSYVFTDLLRRMFEYNGVKVTQIINITDIGHLTSDADDGEDKMTKALKREGKPMTLKAMREVADFYFEKFKEDLTSLNIELPTQFPFASDHIDEDIELIKKLAEKGFTYNISDGIYFNTAKFPDYGKLGGLTPIDNEHSRIGLNSEKKNSRDFALWKFNSELGFDAPFGKGFPGWHIECSAMSRKYLDQPFDIHTGGIDHISVHHNNEIAQSEAAYGVPLANYWMHNAWLLINNGRMGKSEGNFITLQTVKEKGINPLALRYFFLTAQYSTPIEFSWEALQSAETTLKRLKKIVSQRFDLGDSSRSNLKIQDEYYKNKFTEFINNDLDTPKAVALIWDLIKDENISESDKRKMILDFDKFLGLKLDEEEKVAEIPEEVKKLVTERDIARAKKDFDLSDSLRKKIESLGFEVRDMDRSTEIEKI